MPSFLLPLLRIVRALLPMTAIFLAACAGTQQVDYTAFRESRPRSILVLPPINLAPDEKASVSFLSSATLPLAESGYYVIPVTLSEETFKQNGITVAEEAQNISLGKLREIFGADAALYITIDRYGSSYRLIDSVVEVSASARLVDTRIGQELWQGKVSVTQSSNQNSGGGLIGALLTAAINQISNTLSDNARGVAINANYWLLSAGRQNGILYGPYHPKAGTD